MYYIDLKRTNDVLLTFEALKVNYIHNAKKGAVNTEKALSMSVACMKDKCSPPLGLCILRGSLGLELALTQLHWVFVFITLECLFFFFFKGGVMLVKRSFFLWGKHH